MRPPLQLPLKGDSLPKRGRGPLLGFLLGVIMKAALVVVALVLAGYAAIGVGTVESGTRIIDSRMATIDAQ